MSFSKLHNKTVIIKNLPAQMKNYLNKRSQELGITNAAYIKFLLLIDMQAHGDKWVNENFFKMVKEGEINLFKDMRKKENKEDKK